MKLHNKILPEGREICNLKKIPQQIQLTSKGDISVYHISQSLPLYLIKEHILSPGLLGILTDETIGISYQTNAKIRVGFLDLKEKSLKTYCEESFSLSYALAFSFFKEYIFLVKALKKQEKFLSDCQELFDHLTVAIEYSFQPDQYHSHYSKEMLKIIDKVKTQPQSIPPFIDNTWFSKPLFPITDTSDHPPYFDKEQFDTILDDLKMTARMQREKHAMQSNTYYQTMLTLGQSAMDSIKRLCSINKSIEIFLEEIFGKKSCLSALQELEKNVDSSKIDKKRLLILKTYLIEETKQLIIDYQDIFKQEFPFSMIQIQIENDSDQLIEHISPKEHLKKSQLSEDSAVLISEKKGNLALKIMDDLKIEKTVQVEFLANLDKIVSNKSRIEVDNKTKKITRKITDCYWDIWQKAFHLYREKSGKVPHHILHFIHLGVMDDRLITREHMKQIKEMKLAENLEYQQRLWQSDEEYVHSIDNWLEIIRQGEETTSWNNEGENLVEMLAKEHNKRKEWKNAQDIPAKLMNPDTCLDFEIQNFLKNTGPLSSGSPLTAIPIFSSEGLSSNLESHYVNKQKLVTMIGKLLKIDFSIFHRLVVYHNPKLKFNAEFIQRKIKPHFIIIPSVGNKMILWQELGSTSKSSKGRIAIPCFCKRDIHLMLIEVMGAYRWQMTKTLMGIDWNNIAFPSLTSLYSDYVQFIRKNKNLSKDAKEKVILEFRKHRSDRDRFTQDYVHWIQGEAQGMPKLNKVAREIFYHHIPFPKDIRKKLEANPIYQKLDNRLTNLRIKNYNQLTIRYRKRKPLTKELQENLDYYKS